MAVFRALFLVVLSFLWTFTRGDKVSCDFMKSCILPCSFIPGDDVVIHWIQMLPKEPPVHSYYHSKDQLTYQDARFKGRTSLFHDQVSKGNASLLLYNVQIQDQARYKCYISTISGSKESFNELNVEAPVNQIYFEQIGSKMSCSSEGIYPEPELRWSTKPPSNLASKNPPTVQQTEQLLYNISSSLILSDEDPDVDISCTISTSRNSKTAILFKQKSISVSDTQTIQCAASTTPPDTTSIMWRFNHSQVIVDQSRAVSEEWRPYVKEVTDSGDLVLQLSSSDRDGVYTCELNNADEKMITNTFLEYKQGNSSVIVGIVVGLIIIIFIIGIIIYCLVKRKRKQQGPQTSTTSGAAANGVCQLPTVSVGNTEPSGSHEETIYHFPHSKVFDLTNM